ncbi:hypothetical protein [Dysgonomonas capnocytophagoides]|uniref:hypothetical protein n=1 Tax=Dysgonomonas capnocytophagoides TaxID=45254 RepID=UPI003341337F
MLNLPFLSISKKQWKKKTFVIEINGVKESIENVEKLADALIWLKQSPTHGRAYICSP